jgi:hypothetical protein
VQGPGQVRGKGPGSARDDRAAARTHTYATTRSARILTNGIVNTEADKYRQTRVRDGTVGAGGAHAADRARHSHSVPHSFATSRRGSASGKTYRIGVLYPGASNNIFRGNFDGFRQELGAAGYAEGRNLVFDVRFGDGRTLVRSLPS